MKPILPTLVILLVSWHPVGIVAQPNPLDSGMALADRYVGEFSDGNLTLTARKTASGYVGRISQGGAVFPFSATSQHGSVVGSFTNADQQFPFVFSLQDGKMVLETGSSRYFLSRVSDSTNPPGFAATADQVLAEGRYAQLTQSNAEAFVDAVEFALHNKGMSLAFFGIDRGQFMNMTAENFAKGSREAQLAIARATQMWQGVKARWPDMSDDERKDFIREMVVLAWGEQILQAMGLGKFASLLTMPRMRSPSSSAAADTVSDCWGAAGCLVYEPETDKYIYRDNIYTADSFSVEE
jgi:hypothetical protein